MRIKLNAWIDRPDNLVGYEVDVPHGFDDWFEDAQREWLGDYIHDTGLRWFDVSDLEYEVLTNACE
jgi:hypothetical protein